MAAVAVTLAVNEIGILLNFKPIFRAGVAAIIALVLAIRDSRGRITLVESWDDEGIVSTVDAV